MARWLFREVAASTSPQDCPARWVWELERSSGQVIDHSASSFADLALCMNDAAKHGYYGGHRDVYINNVPAA